jgi:hypothetical protein
LGKAVKTIRTVARFMDRLSKPRLQFRAEEPAVYAIAAFCLLVSLITPLLERLPFAISFLGGEISAFGLALISYDGVFAILAFVFCIAAAVIIIMSLL